jgi:anti-anti-sigma factor
MNETHFASFPHWSTEQSRSIILGYRIEEPGFKMDISISHQDDTLTVRLDGTMDYTTTNSLNGLISDINSIRASRVVFDMARVSRVDSVGLGMLHLAKDEIIGKGRHLTIRGAAGNVRRLFELTDGDASFHFE